MKYRLDPELVKAAGLTAKQVEALELYNPGRFGYKSVAQALHISRAAARDRIEVGIDKIERATKEAEVA